MEIEYGLKLNLDRAKLALNLEDWLNRAKLYYCEKKVV